jgi:hypothetical protein
MAFDAHVYQDPALHVKYERQTNPCYGCRHIAKLLGRKFCEKGLNMQKKGRKCGSFSGGT